MRVNGARSGASPRGIIFESAPRRAKSETIVPRILREIRRGSRFLCSSHVRADGDGLGSALAFARILAKFGKRADVVADQGAVPEYRFIPGALRVGSTAGALKPPYSALFTFDCASFDRLGAIGEALPKDMLCINIDHHVSNTRFGTINWVDPSYASTTEMVFRFVQDAGVRLDKILATQIYVGLLTDTGCFSFSNTTAGTHLVAAELLRAGVVPVEVTDRLYRQKTLGELRLLSRFLAGIRMAGRGKVGWGVITNRMTRECGHYPYETQEYVNMIKSVRGVRAAVLLREMKEDPRIRISFRTSAGTDAVKLASAWGGGGHRRASGALVSGNLEEVSKKVVRRAVEAVCGD